MITISFSWPTWPLKHCPRKSLQHVTIDTFDQSQHLLHSLHRSFFLLFSCIFTFLEIIKHNMSKCCCFHLSLILTWLHKNSKILIFLKCMLILCHNLTKLFWMKLKTRSAILEPSCRKKNEWMFWSIHSICLSLSYFTNHSILQVYHVANRKMSFCLIDELQFHCVCVCVYHVIILLNFFKVYWCTY